MKDWPDDEVYGEGPALGDRGGSVPVPETMTRPATPPAEVATGDPDPEWLALLDRAHAGGDDAADAICDAYSRGIRVGLRRAADTVLPATVTTGGPPNYLAMELRAILRNLDGSSWRVARGQIVALVERVAAFAEEAATELTAELVGLEPDQEIRARAAEIVGAPGSHNSLDLTAWATKVLAVADLIRDGSRP